jgi:hypothetical protein
MPTSLCPARCSQSLMRWAPHQVLRSRLQQRLSEVGPSCLADERALVLVDQLPSLWVTRRFKASLCLAQVFTYISDLHMRKNE